MKSVPITITVVCTGNTCRSPMARKLLEHALQAEDEPLRSIEVRSAGLAAFPGDAPSENAVKALQPVNLDISDHRSSPFQDQHLRTSDLILTMTSAHVDLIQVRYPDATTAVKRFREWVPNGEKDVPDPFGGPLSDYIYTRDALVEAIPSIIQHLKTLLDEN